MSNNLASKLRSGTQQAHTAAENVGFTKCFLKGVVNRGIFVQFLCNLYYLYSALEAAIKNHLDHPMINALYFPELNRKASLEKDMEFYYGKDWQKQLAPLKATQTYVARIHQLSANAPELLLGHTYTRYMGDLSGGQLFQKIAQSALQLEGSEGTSFYNFEQIPDKKAFKDKYRQTLDSLPIDDVTALRIVAEANYAFDLNMQMAKELDTHLIQAIGQEMFNNLTHPNNPGSTSMATSEG